VGLNEFGGSGRSGLTEVKPATWERALGDCQKRLVKKPVSSNSQQKKEGRGGVPPKRDGTVEILKGKNIKRENEKKTVGKWAIDWELSPWGNSPKKRGF